MGRSKKAPQGAFLLAKYCHDIGNKFFKAVSGQT
jgi:hypothetical protein